jgi:pyruvate-formate lyase-activating enzyme
VSRELRRVEPNDAHAVAARGDQQASHHAAGLKTVAVTAGYIAPDARREFFAHMDAANVDLKAFTEDFYRSVCGGHLEGVLDTLVWSTSSKRQVSGSRSPRC